MDMSFAHPALGWLALLIPTLWFLPSRPRSLGNAVFRTVIFALGILALMQPVVISSRASEHHVIVVDQSRSLTEDARGKAADVAQDLLNRLADQGTVTLIQIGGVTSLVDATTHLASDGGSPIGDALELAAQSIPLGMSGSVTLISDGLATDRHWGSAVVQLDERDIPVHTLDLREETDDVFIAGMNATTVRVGESVLVHVDVIGRGENLVVSLRHGENVVAKSEPFSSAGQKRVELQFRASRSGFINLVAELSAPNTSHSEKKDWYGILVVQDPVRMAYLGERHVGAADELARLLGPGMELTGVTNKQLTAEYDFTQFDLVMLDDMPARFFPRAAQTALAAAVKEQGVGLFHGGGEGAFGDGGYLDTPIAELLPVKLLGDEDKVDPSVGLAVILDTSGSMAGSRIELAKHLARVAVRRMQPHDRVGIVEFYGNKHWAIPMQPASNKIEIDRAIGRMKAVGGTVLYPAIQEAYYGLLNANTRYKHILLITDAGIEDDNYEALARRIARDNINLSTILVGAAGHNQIMADIANWGQGRFYSVGDQFQLVELIFKQPSTKKPPKYKQGTFAVRSHGGPGWWGEVDRREVPPLDGYVETELRSGAELLAEEAETGHPILSSWRYGLGRVTALTTTPVGSGTKRWGRWGEYAEFLSRVLSRTADDAMPFDLSIKRRHNVVTLRAQRNDDNPALTPKAQLIDPQTGAVLDSTVEFREFAPGLFEADLSVAASESVHVLVDADHGRQRVADMAGSDKVGELQVNPYRALNLTALSKRTGGLALGADNAVSQPLNVSSGEMSFVVTKIWPWLLLATLFVYLAEITHRRWPRTV